MSAQSIRFLFVRVFQKPLAIPKSIYPRKEYKLPMVMSRAEVQQLFSGVNLLYAAKYIMLGQPVTQREKPETDLQREIKF